MIYLIMFSLSSFFLWQANVKLLGRKRNRIAGRINTGIALSLPIFMATFRALSVGADTDYYVLIFFERAHNFSSFFPFLTSIRGDLGYALLTYIMAKITIDIRLMLFAISCLSIIFAYAAFWNFRDYQRPWKMMLFYYFFCYCNSLSQARQTISMSLALFGISLIFKYNHERKGYILCLTFIAVATTFQTGALVMLIPVLIVFAVKKGVNLRKMMMPSLVIALFVAVFSNRIVSLMFRFASEINIKYSTYEYMTVYRGSGISDNLTTSLMCLIVLVLSVLIYIRQIRRKRFESMAALNNHHGRRSLLLLNIAISAIILVFEFFLSSFRVIMRLILTLQIFWPLAIGMAPYLARKKSHNRFLINLGTIIVVALYWYQLYVRVDMVHTANYLLNI